MRDLTKMQFNSNSPMKNYLRLSERIEALESKVKQLEQAYLDLVCSKV